MLFRCVKIKKVKNYEGVEVMAKKIKIYTLTFVIVISAILLGLSPSVLEVPSFDVILTALFGEGNILALFFSLALILLISLLVGFGVSKAIKSNIEI